MIKDGESKTISLIGTAFINGKVASMIDGKFSYDESLRIVLILLDIGTIVIAVDVFSIGVAFSHSRLFFWAPLVVKAPNALVVGDSATIDLRLTPAPSTFRPFEYHWNFHMPSLRQEAYKRDWNALCVKQI